MAGTCAVRGAPVPWHADQANVDFRCVVKQHVWQSHKCRNAGKAWDDCTGDWSIGLYRFSQCALFLGDKDALVGARTASTLDEHRCNVEDCCELVTSAGDRSKGPRLDELGVATWCGAAWQASDSLIALKAAAPYPTTSGQEHEKVIIRLTSF